MGESAPTCWTYRVPGTQHCSKLTPARRSDANQTKCKKSPKPVLATMSAATISAISRRPLSPIAWSNWRPSRALLKPPSKKVGLENRGSVEALRICSRPLHRKNLSVYASSSPLLPGGAKQAKVSGRVGRYYERIFWGSGVLACYLGSYGPESPTTSGRANDLCAPETKLSSYSLKRSYLY